MASHVFLSSEKHDYHTAEWFLDLVLRVDPIVLDPATSADNPTCARYFFSPTAPDGDGPGTWCGASGLAAHWNRGSGLAYINPPYGPYLSGPVDPEYIHQRKCKECKGKGAISGNICLVCKGTKKVALFPAGRGWAEKIAQDEGQWLTLVPTRTETRWFQRLYLACNWRLDWSSSTLGKRINFVDPTTKKIKRGSNIASTVFYHGHNKARFVQVFRPHGTLIPSARICEVLAMEEVCRC